MARDQLSDAKCRNASAGTKAILKLSDGGGLYLWVYANGAKYWRLRYWHAGKEKSLSLGVYPEVSLKEARDKCEEQRKLLRSDLDPSAERKAAELQRRTDAENSFKAVATEWLGQMKDSFSETHANDVLRRFEINVFPTMGGDPIRSITAPRVLEIARKIEKRGAPELARRVLTQCGQVFRYGISTGRCDTNPVPHLKGALKPHTVKSQPAVKPEEVPALCKAIATYDKIGDRQTMLALKLLLLTILRTKELIGAQWSEMDMEAGGLFVPAARMKLSKPDKEVSENEHFVPLSSQALEILRELKELSRGSKFVFPGRNRDKPISNNTMLFALYRLGYKGKMTGHGVRAVASTMMNGQGYSPDVIEAQLAHKEKNRVRAAYNRAQYVPERTKLMQTWADYLWAFLREPAEGQAREVEKTQISPSPMRIIGKAAA